MVGQRDARIDDHIRDTAHDLSHEADLALPISPRIMSRAHFHELLRLERRLARDILNEGIVV